ncbi:glycosyltransferase family 4 protein [Algoriphagus pacificus]|uniref:Glycosyltransferase family 4 protein n=1 Tax=Algoriphagus pacificus TaxID=2811234 RepID=A0ABS3CDQ5_9BACT|nr:glycosyltransferase family 1 protein [Algoriphagus pacificus]MBN7814646.1 glycosyltransferase family 4 protein [Algoriphagus pacificus]
MKVLLDLQYLNVATTGIKTYMVELAKATKDHPHPEIEWIFTHDPVKQAADSTFKSPSSKIQRLNYHLDYFRWKEFQLPDMVKKYKPDVLICPDFVSPAASLPCRRMTVLHDAFFWQMPQNYPRWWRKYFLNLIKKGLKENTEIITTTAYSKAALQEHLGEEHPIHVVYQSPKSLNASSDRGILERNKLEIRSYFFHLGTFDKRKNLPVLVHAFKAFLEKEGKDFKLVLAGGPGQSAQMNDFPIVDKLVSELGLQDKVILPGYVKDEEIVALYQHAFAYVFPSENEGFGIPVIEAMKFGVPVIHSDQAALIEISKGAGLVAKTGDVEDLAEKMILLSRDQALREDLIQKGLQQSKNFSPKKFIEAFQHLILNAAPGL